MSSGSTQTSTQTNSPWAPSVPYLEGAMEKAANLAQKDKGFAPYPGQAWTPYSSQTQAGLNTTEQLASQPNPFYQPNADFTSGLVAGNYNPNAIAQYGTGIASGAQGITTEGGYRQLYGQTNDLFNQALDTQASKLTDDIARTFGGASYGSASNTGAIAEQVGDVRTQAMADQFNTEQAFKAGLLGDVSGVQGQNIANQLSAAGMLSGEQQLGVQNQMAGVGLSDQVYNSQYLPSDRMLGVGAAYDAQADEELQAQMDQYNIQQQQPWNLLGAAYPYFSGTGTQGGTTTTEQPTDPWGKILGGGLLATQAFSPYGMFGSSGSGMY